FGVVKCQFRLMVAAPEYSLVVQTKLVPAPCVLHNFICVHGPDDNEEGDEEREAVQAVPEDFGHQIMPAERTRAGQKRDGIAKAMWAQYIEYTANEN
ncbi:hypothetical protein BDR05DRAFT_871805, partial [Suillus weaverae]